MINTNIKVLVMDSVEDIVYGYRNLYIDKLGKCYVKVKGHYRELWNSYDYYEKKGRAYVDLEVLSLI